MATKVVTGKLTSPSGANVAGELITATLSVAAIIASTQEVAAIQVTTLTASDGTWSLTLQANADLTPSTSYYTITAGVGFYCTAIVPQGAGPYKLEDIMAAAPVPAGTVGYQAGSNAVFQSVTVKSSGPNTSTLADGTTPTPAGVVFGEVYAYGSSGHNILGNGVLDDGSDQTTKIQQVLTNVGNAGGGTVDLPNRGASKYGFSNLTVPANVRLRMFPGGTIYANGGPQSYALVRVGGSTGTAITVAASGALQDVVFDGANVGGAAEDGVLLGNRVSADGLFVFRHGGHGVHNTSAIGRLRRIQTGYNGGAGFYQDASDCIVQDLLTYSNTGAGIYCAAGANNNSFLGGKSEFNTGPNINLANTGVSNLFGGFVIDRSATYGIQGVGSGAYFVLCVIKRNGSAGVANNAHIFADSGSSSCRLYFVECQFAHGTDDGGGGNDTPAYVVNGTANAATVIIANSDQTTASVTGFASPAATGTLVSRGIEPVTIAAMVNYITQQGSITGGTPQLAIDGSDTNVNLGISGKGTGDVRAPFNRNNFFRFVGSTTGTGTVGLTAAGADSNIDIFHNAAGTGAVRLAAQRTNYLTAQGANTGAPAVLSAANSGDVDVDVRLTPKGTGVIDLNYAAVALGGGAAPTVGTIGGSGPATAAQHGWVKLKAAGTAMYVPEWR